LLTITDISGNTEALTGYRGLQRKRNVNGEKTLAFLVLPTEQNAHSYPMVSEESIVEFDGEPYRIKQLAEKSRGTTFYKEVVAVHTFFDLIDEHVYALHTGSMTFEAALQFVLGGTEYTWAIVDTFYAQDFENFGDENRLALFQTLLERYGAEFTLNGTHITFRERIGNATDFQFRYNYNVKTITRDVKTSNLSTYIKGFGKDVESEYTSPNAAVFGMRHAKPVRDERYTTLEGLNERLQAELNDDPEVSITIDFADLRRAGFPFDVPSEGDDVFLIYEPIGIDVETRLVDIDEEFTEGSDLPIKTTVTLGNIRDSVVDRWANVEKQMNDIIGGDGKVKYSVVDGAIRRATEALQSAQTELEFNNGIIAREKTNPNKLVLLNSGGIGVSLDGGQTFRTAMTADGFVADLITAGTMMFDRAQGGSLKLGEVFGDGQLHVYNGSGNIIGRVDTNGIYGPTIQSDNFVGNVTNKWMLGSRTYFFDTANGNDANDGSSWALAKRSPQSFINSMPRDLNNSSITIFVRGTIYGGLYVTGFNSGELIISGDGRRVIYGFVRFDYCRGRFTLQDFDIRPDASTINSVLVQANKSDYIYCEGVRCYGQGNTNHAFWFDASKFTLLECQAYDIVDRGLYATNMSVGYINNLRGSVGAAILVSSGSIVTGEGVRWGGSIIRWNNAIVGGYTEDGANWSNDVWAVDLGEAVIPPPPSPPPATEQTIVVTASTGDNYSTSGYWENDSVKQGSWGYGDRYGLWYGDLSFVRGKTVVSATITVSRNSGGTNAARTINFRAHPYTNRGARPVGSPAMTAVGATGSIAAGETKSFDITAMVQSYIANGTDNSIGIHTTGSTDYMSVGSRPTIVVKYL
jgi:phage minor structural protein